MTNYQKLNNYINFKNKQEMNEHITLHRQQYCYDLNETDKDLLLYISRYSCRYAGVFYQKILTIANALNKSERTIKRSLKKLEQLGIIKRFKNFRKVLGGFGANIIQLQRYVTTNMSLRTDKENTSIPCESKDESTPTTIKPINYSKLKDLKDNNTYATQPSDTIPAPKIDKQDQTPYQQLKSYVQCFINNDNKLIYKLYGIWLAQTKSLIGDKPSFDLALKAIRYTMYAVKNKGVKSITGYFNGTLSNLITKWLDKQIEMYEQDWTLALDTTYEPHEMMETIEEKVEEDLTTDEIIANVWLQETRKEMQYDVPARMTTKRPKFYNWLEIRE